MEQEDVKKTIDDLKEKSVQVFNAENQKKAVRFVDTFFGWMYSASYFFIALLVGLCSKSNSIYPRVACNDVNSCQT